MCFGATVEANSLNIVYMLEKVELSLTLQKKKNGLHDFRQTKAFT